MNRKLATLFLIAAACLASASTAAATRTGQVCRSFTHDGMTYRFETIGTGWTCGSAKTWIVKLSGDRVAAAAENLPLKNGPRGYHCFATLARAGRASAGTCIKGTIAFPKSGFGWIGR